MEVAINIIANHTDIFFGLKADFCTTKRKYFLILKLSF
jgi:hypothetical protein